MIRLIQVGEDARIVALVVTSLAKADRTSLYRLRHGARHMRNHTTGIHTAGKEGPERDIGDKTLLYRVIHAHAQLGGGGLHARRLAGGKIDIPIGADSRRRTTLPNQH